LSIELLDELVWGTRSAAWPLIRHDLSLTYAQVGLVLAIPGFVGSALDPLVGVFGDTPRRRALLVLGGVGFAVSAALSSLALGFWMLLVALVLGNPATGAFVSLTQATLMDLDPAKRERNMARWTLAGSFGYVGGPVLLAAALWFGLGWRSPLALLAVAAVPLTLAARRLPNVASVDGRTARESFAHTLGALRRPDVLRWLALLEASDLLVDVFHGFLALYRVDVARFDPRAAALGVAVWTGAGLLGDWLLLSVLRRFDGRRYLRVTSLAALAVYPTFLLVTDGGVKLMLVAVLGVLNSGWYAIPKAGLYVSLPGRSGATVAVGGLGGLAGASVPLVLGFVASNVGLAATMWILVLAPVALLALTPRRR
jgi:MFS transporter, FSR family, fosmidomycin resistance protein